MPTSLRAGNVNLLDQKIQPASLAAETQHAHPAGFTSSPVPRCLLKLGLDGGYRVATRVGTVSAAKLRVTEV
jgi:hypothetical protein